MTLEELAGKLENVSGFADRRKARCPAHADDVASLSLREVEDGKILLNCFAGCEPKAIAQALKISMADLCGDKKKAQVESARYEYVTRDGEVLYTKIRYEPKDFRFTPSGYRGERVPYRLPEMIEAQGRRVIWVEGEKDAEALRNLDLVATTAGGVNDWRPEMAQWFVGRQVIVIPDNDDPGRGHARQVASALSAVAREVKIVELPGLAPKGDVSDWLKTHSKDELVAVMKAAKVFGDTAIQTFDTISTRDVDWLWFPRIAKGAVSIVFGQAGIGKSTILLDVIARLSRGDVMPNSVEKQPVTKSVIVGIEGPVERTRGVLEASGANLRNVAVVASAKMPEPDKAPLEQIEYLEAEMRKFGASVLLVDNVTEAMMADTDTSNEVSVRRAMRRLTAFAERTGFAVVMISHPKKGAAWGDVNEAITGSQAFTNLPRTTMFVAPVFKDGERTGTCAIAVAKSNLYDAAQVNTLEYSLTSQEIGYRDGHAVTTAPHVEWKGVLYQDAQQLLEAMRPKKEGKAVAGPVVAPGIAFARAWMTRFVPTMPHEGMTWGDVVDAAEGNVSESSLRKVRVEFLKASGQAGKVLWFPLEEGEVPEALPAPPVAVVPAEPPQPASERLERFMASESTADFLSRMAGEDPLDRTEEN